MIALLIPVRGRPHRVAPLVESIHANTTVDHNIVFLASRGDDEQIEACRATNAMTVLIDGGDNEYARKINMGVDLDLWGSPPDFFFLGADDLRFHPGWDEAALALYEEGGYRVIGTNDLGNPTVMRGKHATHSLVHRSYVAVGTIDEPGKLLHPGYHHNYCDTEFCETAKKRGAFGFAFNSHVEHLHPFWRDEEGKPKSPDDPIYELGRKHFREDARLYNTRCRLWR